MSRHDPDRRQFVKAAMAAAALGPWFGRSSLASSQAVPERKVGFALAGLGNLSTSQIAPAFPKTKHCRLAGVITGTPAKGEEWKAKYGLPDRSVYRYEDMARLADNPDIDVVFVVTPNALHAQHTIAAARAGKHVLCEKPMEVSVERCEAMIAACRQAGRQLAIGYRLHFEPHHKECVRLAKDQVLGRVRIIEAGFGFTIGDPAQWRLRRDLAGGGPLMDVGIYALQTARMLTGEEPILVTAVETKTDPVKFREVEESLAWQLTFPGGVIASCNTSYNAAGPCRFAAIADGGTFGIEPAYNYADQRGWRSDGQPLRFDPVDHFAAEMDDFARCILTGTPTSVPGEEGLRDVRVIQAIYEAARTQRAVRLG
jgi:predicted dehydrogenase